MTVILFDLINNHISSRGRSRASSDAIKENPVSVTLGRVAVVPARDPP